MNKWLARLRENMRKSLDYEPTEPTKPAPNPQDGGSVSFVGYQQGAATSTSDLWEAWAERAAIMEYDGGVSPESAERAAFDYAFRRLNSGH